MADEVNQLNKDDEAKKEKVDQLRSEIQQLSDTLEERQKRIDELDALVDNLSTKLASSIFEFTDLLGGIVGFLEKFYEGSHSRFVSKKSGELARYLKFKDEEIWQIEVAGLLHDIGKIGFKDAILAKFPQEMSERETIYYQAHCELGRDLLKKFSEFSIIAEIVYQHHEHIDGTGFPQHLKGKQIHPGAQIIAIVNNFHNLTYKIKKEKDPRMVNFVSQTSLPQSKVEIVSNRFLSALNYLHQRAGILFEKQFVNAFIEIMEKERKALGQKILTRVPVHRLEPEMVIFQNYYAPSGLLVAAKGEVITEDSRRALIRLAEFGAIPANILVLK
ncbi:MAG: HD-GYP domain-containing protein [Candidatus Kapaibacteriales bacterium]